MRIFIPRKRTTRLAVLVMAVVLGGVLAWRLAWYEPGYGGTRLSGWLREFQNEKIEQRLRAAEAVRHIGPRAVPYLVERLKQTPSAKKSRLARWRLHFVEWLGAHTSLNVSTWRNPNARLQALAALDALGPDAKEALPELEKLLEQNPAEIDILFAVARMGDAGVPFL